MRKFWAEYQQESLIFLSSSLLLIDVIAFGLGSQLAIKILPVILTILASLAIFVWQLQPMKKVIIASIIFFGGYFITLLASNTNLFLGKISYGNLLGYKLFGVPFLIGILWLILSISCWHIVSYGYLSKTKKILLGIFIVLIFILALEQFATNLGLWSWGQSQADLNNYIFWMFASGLSFLIFDKIGGLFKPSLFAASLLPILAIYFWLIMLF